MRVLIAGVLVGGVCVMGGGCTTVPPLSAATNNFPFTSNIPIHDIVQRVKCELSDALDDKTKQPDFRWIADWTAKVDLTLEVNNTGGVSPSATYIQPLRNAYVLGTGPSSVAYPSGAAGNSVSGMQQNFNLGFGLSASGSVDRTEMLSFAVSLDELRRWRKQLRQREAREGLAPDSLCRPAGFNDLQGGLDLKSWIDSALIPIERRDLAPGNHPDPGSAAKAPAAKASTPNLAHGGIPPTEKEKALFDAEMTSYQTQVATFASDATKSAGQAYGSAIQVRRLNSVTHAFDGRIRALAYWARLQAVAAQQAATDATQYHDYPTMTDISKETYLTGLENIKRDLTIAGLNADAAGQNAALAAKLADPDPPIDSITHSLQFIVTAGGSISPTWTLVHWKGPSQTGSLASLSGIRTHSLNIALGSPTGGGLNEVNRVLGNQAFRQAIQTVGVQ